jgi:hypothetical protein
MLYQNREWKMISDNKLENMWKEAVFVKFWGTVPEFSWIDRRKPRKTSVTIGGFPSGILIRRALPYTKQYSVDHDVRWNMLSLMTIIDSAISIYNGSECGSWMVSKPIFTRQHSEWNLSQKIIILIEIFRGLP